jgi:hypothetical protein
MIDETAETWTGAGEVVWRCEVEESLAAGFVAGTDRVRTISVFTLISPK